MRPDSIEIGDTVCVMYPGHPNPNRSFVAKVQWIPSATGDSWIFEEVSRKEIYYINEGITVMLQTKGH